MKTETLHDRYLDELKDLYSDEHPPLDVADCNEEEVRRNRTEDFLVFAAAPDKMK
jgi:hypothetical protein